jgi:hypothetical protein
MLDRRKVIDALQTKREQFTTFESEQRRQSLEASAKIERFSRFSADEVMDMLLDRNTAWPGAEPTVELDKAQRLCLPFAQRWHTHENARAWAVEVLRDAPVAAVDGSQIMPSKELSLPVAAIQVAGTSITMLPAVAMKRMCASRCLLPTSWLATKAAASLPTGVSTSAVLC